MCFIDFIAVFNQMIFLYSFINSDIDVIREVLLILHVYLYLPTLIDYLMSFNIFWKVYLFILRREGKERENSKHCQCPAWCVAETQEP